MGRERGDRVEGDNEGEISRIEEHSKGGIES